jgi:hypothetical protein
MPATAQTCVPARIENKVPCRCHFASRVLGSSSAGGDFKGLSMVGILLDDEDKDLLRYNWLPGPNGYCHRRAGKLTILMHREILERIAGRPLKKGEVCDHKNRNRIDNRRANLRIVTHAQNCQHRGLDPRNKSGYRGVSFHAASHKWTATTKINRKQIYCGLHLTPESASIAAAAKRQELNFLTD